MTTRCHWFILVPLLALGCEAKSPETMSTAAVELPQVVVTVEPLQTRSIQREVTAVGTLYGFDEVTLAPKVDGRVRHVFVDTGDVVIPGTVLLELDPTDYELASDEAKRGLDAELARLGLSEFPKAALVVDEVPSVRRAEVSLANAKVRFERVKMLFARQAASKDEFDLAETDLKAADAAKRDVITQALATLASARLRHASLEMAEQRIRDAKLFAPTPPGFEPWAALVGHAASPVKYAVAQRLITTGDMVRSMPVTNAFRLVIDTALKLVVAVPEKYTPEVHVAQMATVRVEAYPGQTFTGVVARISPVVDQQNRTFMVQINVPNFDGKLMCGGFARAAIQTRTDSDVKTVPPHALTAFAGVTKVFIAENGKARGIEVTTGTRDKDWVEVIGPLPENAVVVTSGLGQLVNGSPLKIRAEQGK